MEQSTTNRRATPRPTYAEPTPIRPGIVTRHLWGDEESGYVGDEVLISSDTIHALIFTLAPRGRFGHSPQNRTIFAADELYYVLQGCLLLVNPATGEVQRAEAGEAVFFRRDTWHHGINHGTSPLRVLEIFAPPPAAGTASGYALAQPYLQDIRTADDAVLQRWPMHRQQFESRATLQMIRPTDHLHRLEGDLLGGLIISTEHLTVLHHELLGGARSDLRSHAGDAVLHVLSGCLNINTPDASTSNWWSVPAGESFVIPTGGQYRCINQEQETVRFILAVAPTYRPLQP